MEPDLGLPETLDGRHIGKKVVKFNELNWHATGVINDLPPRRPESSVASAQAGAAREGPSRQAHAATEEDEVVNGRAAELALREVLQSMTEARQRPRRSRIFDFDPYTLSFTGLCLQILPAPPTLFAPTPFATNDSWSIAPPGKTQFDALVASIKERYAANGTPHRSYTRRAYSPTHDPELQKLLKHVEDAYQHWSFLSEATKVEAWHIEVLRSHTRADSTIRCLQDSLKASKARICELEQALNEVRNGFSGGPHQVQSPPSRHPDGFSGSLPDLASDSVKQSHAHSLESLDWDYEELMEKWRGVVRGSDMQDQAQGRHERYPSKLPRILQHPSAPAALDLHCSGTRDGDRSPAGTFDHHNLDSQSQRRQGNAVVNADSVSELYKTSADAKVNAEVGCRSDQALPVSV